MTYHTAWTNDALILHPTDTIPGLSIRPSLPNKIRLETFKNTTHKPAYTCLVSDIDKALSFFMPLPLLWTELLTTIWPGSVSVIWKARPQWSDPSLGSMLTSPAGKISLRVPSLPIWANDFHEFLSSLEVPFPSTSVNLSKDSPQLTLFAAQAFCIKRQAALSAPDVYIDPVFPLAADNPQTPGTLQASTIIEIYDDGSYSVLRQGGYMSPLAGVKIRNDLNG